MTVLNWLNRLLMPLITPVYENCLSPPKWTTLIFVEKLQLSEYHIKMLMIFSHVDNLKTCLAPTKHHIGWSVYDSPQQISTLLGMFYEYTCLSMETLSSEQIVREVGFHLNKHRTVIVFFQVVSVIFASPSIFMIYFNPDMSRMYVALYIACRVW